MTRHARIIAVAGPVVLAGCVAMWSLVPAAAGPDAVEVHLTLRNTRFQPSQLTVHAGTTVRFVVHNEDPIDHELLIGDRAAQDAHEQGTEARHGDKPGEVSVGAYEVAATTYRFEEPGVLLLGCHLPGHWTHGMRGQIRVLE